MPDTEVMLEVAAPPKNVSGNRLAPPPKAAKLPQSMIGTPTNPELNVAATPGKSVKGAEVTLPLGMLAVMVLLMYVVTVGGPV